MGDRESNKWRERKKRGGGGEGDEEEETDIGSEKKKRNRISNNNNNNKRGEAEEKLAAECFVRIVTLRQVYTQLSSVTETTDITIK